MKIIAKLVRKEEVISGETERGTWYRQQIIMESMDGEGRQMAFKVQGIQNIHLFEQLSVGSTLQVGFVIDSRESNGRWFTDLRVINVDVLKTA